MFNICYSLTVLKSPARVRNTLLESLEQLSVQTKHRPRDITYRSYMVDSTLLGEAELCPESMIHYCRSSGIIRTLTRVQI